MRLQHWQHALLSLILLVLGLNVIYIMLVAPAVASRRDFHEKLDSLQFHYAKLISSVGHSDIIMAQIKALKTRQPEQNRFLQEKQQALAAAELQQYINRLITSAGGDLISSQAAFKQESQPIFPGITVKIHMRADTASLQKLLYQIKNGNPVLILDNLLVLSRNIRGATTLKRQTADQLDIRFDATAYIYKGMSG